MSGAEEPKPKTLYGPERKPWRDTLSSYAVSRKGRLLVSPPSRDPLVEYAGPSSHVTGFYYQVTSQGHTATQEANAQKETKDLLQQQHKNFLGYQSDMHMPEYKEPLSPYLEFLSNIGDPFTLGSMTLNTKWMECNVLDYYASLWNGKWPYKYEDPETY